MKTSFSLFSLLLLNSMGSGLVRRGSGVVLVKISSISNPEGRDAAGSCCSTGDSHMDGVCPGNCYSMLKICASQVKNDSILHTLNSLYKDNQKVSSQDRAGERKESDETLSRNPNIPSIKPVNIPTKLVPSNDYRAPIRPLKDRYHKPPIIKKRRPPQLPPKKKNTFPFGSLPNPFSSRSSGKARTVLMGDRNEQRPWEKNEFTVMWRESRVLLSDDIKCRYGTIRTDVIFNNTLGGGQRDLLIKLPFEEAWPGMFELTVEIWHVANPVKIPQLAVQSKKEKDKNIFASILETLGSQLAKTVTDFESKRIKEIEKEELLSLKRIDIVDQEVTETNETSTQKTDLETTTISSADEEQTTILPSSEELSEVATARTDIKKDKLILRLEKDHMIYAGDAWQPGSSSSYHSSIQYSVKLACSKEFTGRTCSFAKLCLQSQASHHPRLICTKEGEIVCRPGWEGSRCERAVCAPGCDPSHGSCERPGECKCRVGWHGPRCDQCDLLLGCSRNGYCTKAFECVCRAGWSGVFCNVPVCSPGCQGSCSSPGQCRCGSGWRGPLCTECSPRPGCLHGSCSAPGECNCRPGWRGALCDEPDCGGGCHPEYGYCNTPGQCYCKVGWQGERCDQCMPYPGCLNGHCTNSWECECEAGWRGHKCDQIETDMFGPGLRDGRCGPDSPLVCMNGGEDLCTWAGNGTQVSPPRCKCRPGFTGRYCQNSLARNRHTVYTQLKIIETSKKHKPDPDDLVLDFPSKLDNSLEKL